MNNIRHIKSLLQLLSALILALVMTACGLVMEPGYDRNDPGDFVELKFSLVTGNVISRADGDWTDNVDSEWRIFEDYINTDDLAFFIFIDKGDGDVPLLMAVTDLDDPNTSIAGAFGVYTLNIRIPKEDFDALGSTLSPASSDKINFRMAVLANTGAGFAALITATDPARPIQFAEFLENAAPLSFNLTATRSEDNDRKGTAYYTGHGDGSVASLYKGSIPMYGLLKFDVREDDLYYSSEAIPLRIPDITMLRSLAKIRVEQKFSHGQVEGLPRILSVSVTSATTRANILPAAPGDYENGVQVTAPNVKEGDSMDFTLGSFGTNTWLGYLPEQAFDKDDPIFTITVQFDADTSKDGAIQQFDVKKSALPKFGTNMLRNHIYTIQADIIGGIKPTVEIVGYTGVTLDPIFGLDPPKEATPTSQAE